MKTDRVRQLMSLKGYKENPIPPNYFQKNCSQIVLGMKGDYRIYNRKYYAMHKFFKIKGYMSIKEIKSIPSINGRVEVVSDDKK